MNYKALLFIISILTLGVVGSYFLSRKFLRDRASAMNFDEAYYRKHQARQSVNNPTQTKKIYTKEEIEEARKTGKLPGGVKQPYIPPANNAGEQAVQRSLKTLEEINKINAMNQQLMDQQRRMQNQK